MTDVQDVKTPYEVLIRYGDHGRPVGAHVQYLRTVTVDGEVMKAEVLPPEDIAMNKDFPTNEIMSKAARAALAQISAAEDALKAALDTAADAQARIETLEKTNLDLGEKLKIGILENGELRQALTLANDTIKTLSKPSNTEKSIDDRLDDRLTEV